MDVALDGGDHHLAVGAARSVLLLLDIGNQRGDRFFHDPRRFDDLRQEHLAGAEQVADHVHAVHQRPFDDVERPLGPEPRLFGVLENELVETLHQRVLQALFHRELAPLEIIAAPGGARAALELLGNLQQPFRGIGAPRENDVLTAFAEVGGYVLVNRELARVDDTHGQTGANGVVEKYRVHGLAHRVVAAERKRHIADAAADMHRGHALLDGGRGFDEIEAVAIVFLDARRHGEYVGIEDDVFGRKSDAFRQQPVGTFANRHLPIERVGLTLLVEGHDDHGGAIAHHLECMRQECFLALLQADRIDDGFALHAFEARFDHRPFGRIDHDGYARNIRFTGDEAQELRHDRRRIEHALIHVHVDDLRAVGHLLPRDVDRRRVVARFDELAKLRRSRHVGALTDIDEQAVRVDVQRFQPAQAAGSHDVRQRARRQVRDGANHGANVVGRGAATAAHHIDEPAGREFA